MAAALVGLIGVAFILGIIAGPPGEGWTGAARGFAMLAMADTAWTSGHFSLRPAASRPRRAISLVLLIVSLIGAAGAFLTSSGLFARTAMLLLGGVVLLLAVVVTRELRRTDPA